MLQRHKIEEQFGKKIIWPLILEIDDVTFSIKQYQKKNVMK